jgi:predicted nucleic acid-binding protein
MLKVFVDTDVCIDYLSGRKPFVIAAEKLFSLGDKKRVKIYVSALTFSNIDYVLRSQYSSRNISRKIITQFKTLVTVLPVDSKTIDLALASDFSDFEDGIQYYTALENGMSIILTRDIKGFKKASINVMTPDAFLLSK